MEIVSNDDEGKNNCDLKRYLDYDDEFAENSHKIVKLVFGE